MKTLYLIDANSLIHRAFHALPGFTAPNGRPTGALYGVANILLKIIREKKPDYVAAAFDRPEPTFRDKEYAEYKGTRPAAADELISQIIESRRLMGMFGIKIFESAGWEADDIIMTLANRFAGETGLKTIIFSGDLDILQAVRGEKVVAEVPQKGISTTMVYDEPAVIKRFGLKPSQLADYKGLVGDTSDNIPGVAGIGPKTAATVINKYGPLESLYKEIEEMGLSDIKLQKKLEAHRSVALLSKRLATLRTDAPAEADLNSLALKEIDAQKALPYFRDLGFGSLVSKLTESK
jgi:DNA polymerase-1